MSKVNICTKCKYAIDGWCNRLVVSGGFGMNDRLGRDYKRNNQCPYFSEGVGRVGNNNNMPMWNS